MRNCHFIGMALTVRLELALREQDRREQLYRCVLCSIIGNCCVRLCTRNLCASTGGLSLSRNCDRSTPSSLTRIYDTRLVLGIELQHCRQVVLFSHCTRLHRS